MQALRIRTAAGAGAILALCAIAFGADAALKPFALGKLAARAAVGPEQAKQIVGRTVIPLSGDWLVQPVAPKVGLEQAKVDPAACDWPEGVLPQEGKWLVGSASDWRTKLRSPNAGEDAKALSKIDGRDVWEFTSAWLVKDVQLPELRAGQKVLLSLDQVWGGIGRPDPKKYFRLIPSHVYVNGRYAGTIEGWQRKRLDVTGLVRDGRLRVAILNGHPGLAGYQSSRKMRSQHADAASGIYGPAAIEVTRPGSTLFVDQLVVTPSVRQERLGVRMRVGSDAAQEVTFRARLFEVPDFPARKAWPPAKAARMARGLGPDAKVSLSGGRHTPGDYAPNLKALAAAEPAAALAATAPTRLADGGSEVAVTFPVAGKGLKTWSPAHPQLYWIVIEALDPAGRVVGASAPVTFGYREFWVDGPHIRLNGVRVNLYGTSHMYFGTYYWAPMDLAAKHGLGLGFDRVMSTWWRGYKWAAVAPILADRWGHLWSGHTSFAERMHWYLGNAPSLVMWQVGGNGFVNGPHSHPMQIGGAWDPPKKGDARYDEWLAVRKRVEDLREIDPSRPTIFYRLGYGGDIRGLMGYLDIQEPIMDLMDWPMGWFRNAQAGKVEPFMSMELGYTLNLYGMKYWKAPAKGFGSMRLANVEHAARFLGGKAYGLIRPAEMLPAAYEYPYYTYKRSKETPLLQAMYAHVRRHVLPAWRTAGISFLLHGEGKPIEHYADVNAGVLTERGKVFAACMAPRMAYLAGPGDDFNARDHGYVAGQTVRKQVVLLNDTFRDEPVAFEVRVRATVGEREVYEDRRMVQVANAVRGSVDITFEVPDVAGRADGVIEARVRADGKDVSVEPFAFQVFPKVARPKLKGRLVLVDPVGDTAALLDRAGVTYTKAAPGDDFSDASLLVIGRNAYAQGLAEKLNAAALAKLLAGGGNVIVFEQTARHVAGLTNEHFNLRYVFVRDPRHPVLAGLRNEDLAMWRGESNLLEPWQSFTARGVDFKEANWRKHGLPNRWGQRRRFVPQWSNRNMVATFCYHKPQAGNVRVLLDGGFDSLYTPLVEVGCGNGTVLLCQLDVTNRYGQDPAATRLVNAMLSHYAAKQPAREKAVVLLGDETTAALAKTLGLSVEQRDAAEFKLDPARHVALVQPGTEAARAHAAGLAAFVRGGGTALVLGAFEEDDLAPLKTAGLVTFEYGVATADAVALRDAPALLAGLSPSDFFYRRFMPGVLATAAGKGWSGAGGLIHVANVGRGRVVYVAVRPEVFQVKWLPNKPSWQQTEVNWPTSKFYRIVSTVLSNAGATAEPTVKLPSGERSEALYPLQVLDFDPMQSWTW